MRKWKLFIKKENNNEWQKDKRKVKKVRLKEDIKVTFFNKEKITPEWKMKKIYNREKNQENESIQTKLRLKEWRKNIGHLG